MPITGGAIDVGSRQALERKLADDHRGFGRDRHGARGACLLGYATRFCGTRPLWPLSGCRVVWNSLSIVGAVCRFFAGLVWASAGTAGAVHAFVLAGRRPTAGRVAIGLMRAAGGTLHPSIGGRQERDAHVFLTCSNGESTP